MIPTGNQNRILPDLTVTVKKRILLVGEGPLEAEIVDVFDVSELAHFRARRSVSVNHLKPQCHRY